MKKTFLYIFLLFLFAVPEFSLSQSQPVNPIITLGAYYFDGWTGTYSYHLTKALTDTFQNRESKWGWITSTQSIVDQQIIAAAESGLSFFSFCWYYNGKNKYKTEPLNQALKFYLKSPEKSKLKFCLMVANHQGFYIGPQDWPVVVNEWIADFKSGTYLMTDGKPLIIFYSPASLVKTFGSPEQVKAALDSLRSVAKNNGLKGVSIAACVYADKKETDLAAACGFDVLTGYNYHTAGLRNKIIQTPIDSLHTGEQRAWSKLIKFTDMKYIPVSTLNWDPRPWATKTNGYATAPYYIGYSPNSVYSSVKGCKNWMNNNRDHITAEKIAILYAWNETGEGAWLTPGKNGVNMLTSIKKALSEK